MSSRGGSQLSEHCASMYNRSVYQSVHILRNEHNAAYAEELLVRAAKQSEPIAEKRGWKVERLKEFYPRAPELHGLNANRSEISVRLRLAGDRQAFLEYEHVLKTLLHELAHMVHSEHSAAFYALLDELEQEAATLRASGITQSAGHGTRLGSTRLVVPGASRSPAAAVRKAWLLRSRTLMAQGSVQRLGGDASVRSTLTPAQAAARAAERRLLDDKNCSTHRDNHDDNDDDDDDDDDGGIEILSTKSAPPPPPPPPPARPEAESAVSPKKRRRAEDRAMWVCRECTLINDGASARCDACNSRPPASATAVATSPPSAWICRECTFSNVAKTSTCAVCSTRR